MNHSQNTVVRTHCDGQRGAELATSAALRNSTPATRAIVDSSLLDSPGASVSAVFSKD